MSNWAREELKNLDLGDRRRNERLIKMVSDLAAQPNASVPQASGDWAATQGAYDFWGNKRVKAEEIRRAHQKSTVERVQQHQTIVATQDTTELNFSHHSSKKGMGHLDNSNSRGLKIHSVFCVSLSGVPLGLLHQKVWARDINNIGKKHQRNKKETKEKESKRWLEGLSKTEEAIPENVRVITVADREADIYDFLAMPRRANSELLIRAYQNRSVKTDFAIEKLTVAIASKPGVGEISLELQRTPDRKPRQATLTLRTKSVEIQPPKTHLNYNQLKSIRVQVIKAEEENPPTGEKPVSWLLLTTLKVNDFNDVVQCLRWYSYRWLIERYHYVLKSGCRLEQLQLETADRIERALATYTIVAWRLLWLTYEARYNPDAPADTILDTFEWQALYCTIHKTSTLPSHTPSIKDCIFWIAKLGGFLCRKRDGFPGVKTIWQGLRRLHDIVTTWQIVQEVRVT